VFFVHHKSRDIAMKWLLCKFLLTVKRMAHISLY
jgi:hypothetical protein